MLYLQAGYKFKPEAFGTVRPTIIYIWTASQRRKQIRFVKVGIFLVLVAMKNIDTKGLIELPDFGRWVKRQKMQTKSSGLIELPDFVRWVKICQVLESQWSKMQKMQTESSLIELPGFGKSVVQNAKNAN